MSVSIIEALQNANYNLRHNGLPGVMIAKAQLSNAVRLLEKGYSLNEQVEPLLEKYGHIENVPPKDGKTELGFTCSNCGTFQGDQELCPKCGQDPSDPE